MLAAADAVVGRVTSLSHCLSLNADADGRAR
jgi:hypothetical protein